MHGRPDRSKLFTASLFTLSKEKASEASEKHAGVGGMWGLRAKQAIYLRPHHLPSQIFRFALASSSLAILDLSARSTIE